MSSWALRFPESFHVGHVVLAIYNLLSQKDFLSQTLSKTLNRSVDVEDVKTIRVRKIQEGRDEGVLIVSVLLSDWEFANFVVVIPKHNASNEWILENYHNLRTLHDLDSRFVPEPYALGEGQYETESSEGGESLFMFAVEYLDGYTEVNAHSDGKLNLNAHRGVIAKKDDIVDYSDQLKRLMIKILTIYYIKNGQQMIAYDIRGRMQQLSGDDETYYPGFDLLGGIDIEAGDFMYHHNEGNHKLRLITVRGFRKQSINDFIASLIGHEEDVYLHRVAWAVGTLVNERIFTQEQVYGGIQDALVEIHGDQEGQKLAGQWIAQYESASSSPVQTDLSQNGKANVRAKGNAIYRVVEGAPEESFERGDVLSTFNQFRQARLVDGDGTKLSTYIVAGETIRFNRQRLKFGGKDIRVAQNLPGVRVELKFIAGEARFMRLIHDGLGNPILDDQGEHPVVSVHNRENVNTIYRVPDNAPEESFGRGEAFATFYKFRQEKLVNGDGTKLSTYIMAGETIQFNEHGQLYTGNQAIAYSKDLSGVIVEVKFINGEARFIRIIQDKSGVQIRDNQGGYLIIDVRQPVHEQLIKISNITEKKLKKEKRKGEFLRL